MEKICESGRSNTFTSTSSLFWKIKTDAGIVNIMWYIDIRIIAFYKYIY